MRDGVLKRGKTQSEMAAGGVSGNAELFEIEPRDGIIFVFAQCSVSAADIFKCSGPSTAGIAHATVFDVPGCDACLFERVAKMPGISEVVFGAPVSAVNEENDRMRAFARGNANVDKLIGVLAVRKAQIGVRRFLLQNGFALHGEKYRTALRK